MFWVLPLFLFAGSVFSQNHKVHTSDGIVLHVTVKGEGIPCLYLHGGPGSGSWWLEKFMGDELEQRFQMIYLDQRGVARSTGTEHCDYTMERMVKDFEEVRAYLGIEKWLTMGHSFGGLLQMGYALQHPEAIKGMLMINAALDMQECFESSWCPKAMEFAGIEDTDLCNAHEPHFVERWNMVLQMVQQKNIFWRMGYAEEENMHIMNNTFGDIPDWNWRQGSQIMEVEDYHKNFKPFTVQLSMPVLFFYGKTDWMIGPDHYQGIAFPELLLWGSPVGHMPFMENRTDLLKALDTFMQKFGL